MLCDCGGCIFEMSIYDSDKGFSRNRRKAGVVIFNPPTESVLLVQSRGNLWGFPKGSIEENETIKDAAIREVREETGLKVKGVGLGGGVASIHRDHVGSVQYHYTLVDLLAQPVGGTLAAGGDVVDAKWFEINAVYGMELWSETKRIIRLAVEMAEIISD